MTTVGILTTLKFTLFACTSFMKCWSFLTLKVVYAGSIGKEVLVVSRRTLWSTIGRQGEGG
jgi:hypothetical protein